MESAGGLCFGGLVGAQAAYITHTVSLCAGRIEVVQAKSGYEYACWRMRVVKAEGSFVVVKRISRRSKVGEGYSTKPSSPQPPNQG